MEHLILWCIAFFFSQFSLENRFAHENDVLAARGRWALGAARLAIVRQKSINLYPLSAIFEEPREKISKID